MTEIDQVHTNPLTALGGHAWGWEIPVYLFLGGITAGIMIFTAILGRRFGEKQSRWVRLFPFVGPVLISLGMVALFLDLSNRWSAYRFYMAFKITAPMSWGAWILLAIYPASLALGLSQLKESESEWLKNFKLVRLFRLGGLVERTTQWGRQKLELLRWSNMVLGVALGGYTGILLSTLAARAAWNSAVLGPLFLVSGVSTGAAMMMLFPMQDEERHTLRNWDVGAIIAELSLLGLFLAGLTSGGADTREVAGLFMGGSFTAPFWTLVVGGGLLVPLALEAIEARKHLRPTVMAPVLLLVGGLSLRWIMVVVGQLP